MEGQDKENDDISIRSNATFSAEKSMLTQKSAAEITLPELAQETEASTPRASLSNTEKSAESNMEEATAAAAAATDTPDNTVTKAMQEEEERLAIEQAKRDEAKRQQDRAQWNEEIRSQKQKRLKFLIDRAGIYSKWLAEKLEARQSELASTTVDESVVQNEPLVPTVTPNTATETHSNAYSTPAIASSTLLEAERKTMVRGKRKSAPSVIDPSDTSIKPRSSKRGRPAQSIVGVSGQPNSAPVGQIPKRNSRQPSLVTGGELREYQLIGMEWLISLYENALNGILADEMGLGKTIQTIAFLAHLKEMGTHGPFIIVAPLSTLGNWVAEIRKFTPSIPVVLYHGSQAERAELRDRKMSFRVPQQYPIVVTSYEICMNDRKHLQHIHWKYLVLDEGHRIKSNTCRLVRELKSYHTANRLLLTGTPLQNNLTELWSLLNFLMPDIFDDLSSFEDLFDFDANFAHPDSQSISESDEGEKKAEAWSFVSNLHQILKPFLLRRVKTEVVLDLPKKREYILHAPLTPKQKELYEAAINGVLRDSVMVNMLNGGDESTNTRKKRTAGVPILEIAAVESPVQSDETSTPSPRRSRRVSEAPCLTNTPGNVVENVSDESSSDYGSPHSVTDVEVGNRRRSGRLAGNGVGGEPFLAIAPRGSFASQALKKQKLQSLAVQLRKICNHPYLFDIGTEDPIRIETKDDDASTLQEIVFWSGKMLMLERLIPELLSRGHKILIFSQMTRMLDIIGDWLTLVKQLNYCRIDGSVHITQRQEEIANFNKDPSMNIFLLSTRAGGLGINLTAADTVIIFDSDWNPQCDLQAQDRVHRIGQTRPVVIYRLVTANSIESRIIETAHTKRTLEKLVIHKEQFKGSKKYYQSEKVTDVEELLALLKSSDSEALASGMQQNEEGEDGGVSLMHKDPTQFMERVLSSADLERILDRSPEAYAAALETASMAGASSSVTSTSIAKASQSGVVQEFEGDLNLF